ncbi:MAG: Hsp33 family molecular chaperone HslO [Deltaproteobacteria bacterium]|nr:MAG: Hsp33 family molecular chaperone HslO [Deltaproteobacteria bacterium]
MNDSIERVISEKGDLFGVACNTTGLVAEACTRHDVGPLAAMALGRALTGAALLAALLKEDQSVLLKFEANGPLGKIITEAGFNGWVRGYVKNPHADVPLKNKQIDVASGLGQAGLLTVIKSIAQGKQYPGTIPLYTGEIGDDLAYYLLHSEQTPSTVGLSVQLETNGTVSAAGGFLVQSLPPADKTALDHIEEEIARLPSLSDLYLRGKSPAEVLSVLLQKVPHKKIHSRPLYYSCSCNPEKMEKALSSLGKKTLQQLKEEKNGAEVRCEFCRKIYTFTTFKLDKLLLHL